MRRAPADPSEDPIDTRAPSPPRRGPTLALFTFAIGVAAALLFVVQPMVGKMILPRGGGSPQVWITSMLFFQTALLAGYAYAHFSVRWLGPGRQMLVHLVVLALPLLVLPIALPDIPPPAEGGPSFWILTRSPLSMPRG